MEEIQSKKAYMEAVTKKLLDTQPQSYDELIQLLHQFMVGTLEYYLLLFVDAAFEGEMEMLPPEAQAAVHLNNMFSREPGDRTAQLFDMKQATQCYPQLGEYAKILAQYIKAQIQEEKQAQKQAVSSVSAELLQMVEVMKGKVCQMIEQGMIAEAKATIAQLRAMVPEDTELAELENALSKH